MSQTDRDALAKGLEDRSAALGRIESAEVSEREDRLRKAIRIVRKAPNLKLTYEDVITRIKRDKKISETTKDRKCTQMRICNAAKKFTLIFQSLNELVVC